MNDKTEEQLIQEHTQNVEAMWSDHKAMSPELKRLLQNFGHRYFPDDFTVSVVKESDVLNVSVVGQEFKLKEGIKHSLPEVKEGCTELAKNVSYSDKPCMRYTLGIKHQFKNQMAMIEIMASISWDFPNFSNESKSVKNTYKIQDKDLFILRKKLSQSLEEACSLF